MTDGTGQPAGPTPASGLKLRQIMEGVVDQGRILVADLHKVLKNAQVHARDNEAFLRPLAGLAKTLQALRALQDRVVLRLVDEYLFIGDHRTNEPAHDESRIAPDDFFPVRKILPRLVCQSRLEVIVVMLSHQRG